MKTYVSESNIKPVEWQLEKTRVYHNTNVVEAERQIDAETVEKYFKYDVSEMTYDEYNLLLNKSNSEAIDEIVIAMLGE